MLYNVPFQANIDDTHCFQAVIKMVVEYFSPEEKYYWEQLDQITGKETGLWTWPTLGYIWLQKKGLQVEIEELFDYQAFIEKGEQYLIEFAGKEAGEESIRQSNIPLEIERTRQAIDQLKIKHSPPTQQTIKDYLEKGYLVICNVNANQLNDKVGYVGHFVLVVGFEGDDLIMHDPGKPPLSNRKVSFADFERAWADPKEQMKNLVAVKKID